MGREEEEKMRRGRTWVARKGNEGMRVRRRWEKDGCGEGGRERRRREEEGDGGRIRKGEGYEGERKRVGRKGKRKGNEAGRW